MKPTDKKIDSHEQPLKVVTNLVYKSDEEFFEISDFFYELTLNNPKTFSDGDPLVSSYNGYICVEYFIKEQELGTLGFEERLLNTIKSIEKAKGECVISIDNSYLSSISGIAKEVDLSQSTISRYTTSERGDGTFPPSILNVGSKYAMYRMSEVLPWLSKRGSGAASEVMACRAQFIEQVNLYLTNRRVDKESMAKIISALD